MLPAEVGDGDDTEFDDLDVREGLRVRCGLRHLHPTKEALVLHVNAPLSPTGRLRLARCVVEDGWPLRRAAERFQVAVTTAARWSQRDRQHGAAGMADRSSRPRRSPARTPSWVERRILKVRVLRRWGPARIGYLLGVAPSTAHQVLVRYRVPRLSGLDRATGRPIRRRVMRRYEHAVPGDLVPSAGTPTRSMQSG